MGQNNEWNTILEWETNKYNMKIYQKWSNIGKDNGVPKRNDDKYQIHIIIKTKK